MAESTKQRKAKRRKRRKRRRPAKALHRPPEKTVDRREPEGLSTRSAEPVRPIEALRPLREQMRAAGLTVRGTLVEANSWDEATRSVDAVLATENPVRVIDWERWEIIEEVLLMRGVRPPDQVPLLDTHDRSTIRSQYGSVRQVRVEGAELLGRPHFASDTDSANAATKVREGHVRDGSVGYRVLKYVDIEPGESAVVAGKPYKAGPDFRLRVTTEWELREWSLCAIGADGAAKVRAENMNRRHRRHSGKDSEMKTFDEWLAERGLELDGLSEESRAALEADYEAWKARDAEGGDGGGEQPAAGEGQRTETGGTRPGTERTGELSGEGRRTLTLTQEDLQRTIAEAMRQAREEENRAEQERIRSIRDLAGEDGANVPTELVERAIRESWDAQRAGREFLTALRQQRDQEAGPAFQILERGSAGVEAMSAALLMRSGVFREREVGDADDSPDEALIRSVASMFGRGQEARQRAEEAVNRGDGLRGLSLMDLARMCIRMDGGDMPGIGRTGDEVLLAAFGRDSGRAFATLSLPKILGNTARLSMLRGYNATPDTWRSWCSIGNLGDFHTHTRARYTDTGELEIVRNDGEIAQGAGAEEYETISVDTYARNTSFTRQNMINDDLDVLTKQRRRDGRRAKQRVAKLVYTTLLANGNMSDGKAWFSTDHSNLTSSKALSPTNLGFALQKFRKQTDLAGEPVDIEPRVLLVPPELEVTAAEILKSDYFVGGSSKAPARNVVKDLLRERMTLEIENRLSNSAYTGYSTTGYYLFASPEDAETMTVAFLNGVQVPTTQVLDPGANVLGTIFRVFLDFGCAAMDYRSCRKQHND